MLIRSYVRDLHLMPGYGDIDTEILRFLFRQVLLEVFKGWSKDSMEKLPLKPFLKLKGVIEKSRQTETVLRIMGIRFYTFLLPHPFSLLLLGFAFAWKRSGPLQRFHILDVQVV